MKLSEAIREGAKLRPQSFDGFFSWDDDNREFRSCALGAAVEAIRGAPVANPAAHYQLPGYIGENFDGAYQIVTCPDPHCRKHQPVELVYMVMELNDQHRWTRERIADWVETVEAA